MDLQTPNQFFQYFPIFSNYRILISLGAYGPTKPAHANKRPTYKTKHRPWPMAMAHLNAIVHGQLMVRLFFYRFRLRGASTFCNSATWAMKPFSGNPRIDLFLYFLYVLCFRVIHCINQIIDGITRFLIVCFDY